MAPAPGLTQVRAVRCDNDEVIAFDDIGDELSQTFAQALISAFPEWQNLASVVPGSQERDRFIEVVVPQEGTDRFLRLSTEDEEISIAFDDWHEHIGPFLGFTTAQSVEAALKLIEDFTDERIVVKVFRRNGVWDGSTIEAPDEPIRVPPHCTMQVVSWRGTFDRTIESI